MVGIICSLFQIYLTKAEVLFSRKIFMKSKMSPLIWIIKELTKQRMEKGLQIDNYLMRSRLIISPSLHNEIKVNICITGELIGKVNTIGSLLWYFLNAFMCRHMYGSVFFIEKICRIIKWRDKSLFYIMQFLIGF